MDYYESGDLGHYITRKFYNLDWNNKLDILNYIIKGLDHIHGQNVIHRDLHSGNILCSNPSNKHPVVISDLGISKSSTESIDSNEIYGLIPYMAPEIFKGQKYTTASDVYSFGMIMWELMTGRMPFWDRNHDTELIFEICDGLRPSIVTNAPEGYIELMKKCWHPDPNKRPIADYLKKKLDGMNHIEWENRIEYDSPTKIVKSSDIGPITTNDLRAIYKSRPLSSMINL
jgi:serine/threonine protein kinase